MIERDEILRLNPIQRAMEGYGITFHKIGKEIACICPFHDDHSPSLRVSLENQMWYCDPCQRGGSIIDFVSMKEGISIAEAIKKLSNQKEKQSEKPFNKKVVAKYEYKNEQGEILYKVIRFEPKDFRQARQVDGKTIWSLDNVRRVLYRLPDITRSQQVVITEGEKDVETLVGLGFEATCNAGGAGKWLDAYTESLKGKDVVIIPDNDIAGNKHKEKLIESLSGKVKSLRLITIPDGFKDVSEWREKSIGNHKDLLIEWISKANPIGIDLPIYSMAELREKYIEFVKTLDKTTLNFNWLPSLKKHVRGLVPGELVAILADTGVGKTAIVQNIAKHAYPLKTLLFELELADNLIYERFTQIEHGVDGMTVENAFKNDIKIEESEKLSHVFTCPISKQTPESIEELIIKSELKLGEKPRVVIIDYVGLVRGIGNSRYEKLSNVAEEIKRIAKATQTVIIIASQIHRKGEDSDGEIYLHDAKDSGSIENSAGLVLGAWKESQDKMILKILKNTKGSSGWKIPCHFHGPSLRIKEMIENKSLSFGK